MRNLSLSNGKDVIFTTDGYVEMKENEKYVIFLKRNPSGNYRLLTIHDGKFSHYINKARGENPNISLREQVLKKYPTN